MSEKRRTTTTLIAVAVIALIVGAAVGVALAPSLGVQKTVQVQVPPLQGEIDLGALLPLTGDLASYGQHSQAAIMLAQSDVNAFLQKAGQTFSIKVLVEDTETKPDVALTKLQSLAAQGIKLYIGPQSSGEARNILTYANSNQLLLISQSSTAPNLAIPDDFLYRFCPADSLQGQIAPALFHNLGITNIIYVHRGDAWGDGLFAASSANAQKLGETVAPEIRYAPASAEFSSEAKALDDQVKSLMSSGVTADKIGIEIMAFAEAVAFMTAAKDYPELAQVHWFGSDGTAQLAEVIKDPAVAAFVSKIKWVNPIFALPQNEKYLKVQAWVQQQTGSAADSYAYSAYDIVWVLTLALMQVQKNDGNAVKNVLSDVAGNYYGAIGWVKLNEAGDLGAADYFLFVVSSTTSGAYDWTQVGTYSFATNSFIWTGGFTP